jgi:leucyl-tRNA synthetase
MVTGRPAFSRTHIYGTLNIIERSLEPRAGVGEQALDEERFLFRTVRRPMRHGLGNVVEPGTLVRRFGADALRLGYLLCAGSGFSETATASESQLRKARKSVRLFTSKLAGLSNMLRAPARGGAAKLGDRWVVARCRAAVETARKSYEENRLDAVATALIDAMDDFVAYVNVVAARRRGDDLGAVASTVSTVIKLLGPAFAPVCPHLFERLGDWVAEKWPAAEAAQDGEPWLSELVDELSESRGEAVVVGAADPAALGLLIGGSSELSLLSKARVSVADSPPAGKATAVGPCIVVRPGELSLLQGGSPAADWYASLHGKD